MSIIKSVINFEVAKQHPELIGNLHYDTMLAALINSAIGAQFKKDCKKPDQNYKTLLNLFDQDTLKNATGLLRLYRDTNMSFYEICYPKYVNKIFDSLGKAGIIIESTDKFKFELNNYLDNFKYLIY